MALPLVLVPFSPPLLHPHDHHLLRYYAAVMRVMRRVLHRAFLLLRPASNDTVKQLLFALPGYSMKQYKEFTKPERLKLDNDVSSEEYDVSLLHRLLQRVCGLTESNSSVAGTLENRLKVLKGHRNALAHEELLLSSEELRRRVGEVEDLCRDVLVIAGLRSRQEVVRYVREMEEGVNEILTGNIDMWEPYRQGLERLRQEQCNILVREGKNELRLLSQRLCVLNPFAWVLESDFHLTIEEAFTELELEGSGVIDMQDLLRLTMPSGHRPDAVIVSGSPGIGKTSLTRFLLHDWLSDDPTVQGLDDFDLLLPIEVRNVSSTDVCSLVREELLPGSCRHLHRDDVLATLRGVSVLWVIDGYDEATDNTRNLIKELLNKFQNSIFFITMRTECRREVELLLSGMHISHLTIVNKGFSDENIRVCTEKLFRAYVNNPVEKTTSMDQFFSFLGERATCLHMLRVPLLLTMLVVLWLQDTFVISGATTITRLHHVLINHMLTKMFTRQSSSRLGLSESRFKKKMEVFLTVLGKFFWLSDLKFTYKDSDFEIEELEKVCNDLDLPFKDTMSPFFTFDVKAKSGELREIYTVIHRTVKEFLSGRAFSLVMVSEGWDVLTAASHWRRDGVLLQQQYDTASGEPESLDVFIMEKLNETGCEDYSEEVFPHNDRFETDSHGSSLVRMPAANDVREQARERCYRYFNKFTPYSSSFTIFFIAGYLKLRKELTYSRAEQLVYVISLGDYSVNEYSLWLRLIQESEEDTGIIQEVSNFLTTFQWAPEPQDNQLVQDLLKYVTPELVFLLQGKVLDECSGLRQLSHTFSRVPAEIHLDFRNQFLEAAPSTVGASECLEVLLDKTSRCRLTTLCCFMNEDSVGFLKRAPHLQELCIKIVSTKDLHRLSEALPSLYCLRNLMIHLDPNLLATRPRELSTLELPSGKEFAKSMKMARCFRILPQKDKATDQSFHLGTLFDMYSERWNLPSVRCAARCSTSQNSLLTGNSCNKTPPMLFQRHSRATHMFSMHYHRESLRYLRGVHRLVQSALCTLKQSKKKKFNIRSKCSDPLGSWRSWLVLWLCETMIMEHRTSIALHRRVLTYHGLTTLTPPSCVTLVLPDALGFDPRQVGAVVGRLCWNPMLVKLEGRVCSTDAEHLASLVFWIGSSVSRVQCIRVTIETTRKRRKELANLEGRFLKTVARSGASFKYLFNWWYQADVWR